MTWQHYNNEFILQIRAGVASFLQQAIEYNVHTYIVRTDEIWLQKSYILYNTTSSSSLVKHYICDAFINVYYIWYILASVNEISSNLIRNINKATFNFCMKE